MRLSLRASPILRARSSPVPLTQPFAPPEAPPVFKKRFITGERVIQVKPDAYHEPLESKLGRDAGFRYWPPGRAVETTRTVRESFEGDDLTCDPIETPPPPPPPCPFGPNYKIHPSFAKFETTEPTGRNPASPEGVKIAVAKLFDLPILLDNAGRLFIKEPSPEYVASDEDFITPASGEGFEKILVNPGSDVGGGWPLKYHERHPYNLPELSADGPLDTYFGSATDRANAKKVVESSTYGAKGQEDFSDKPAVVEKEDTLAAMQRFAAEYDTAAAQLERGNAPESEPSARAEETVPPAATVSASAKARPSPAQSESAVGGTTEDRQKRKSPMRRPRVGDVM